MTTQIDADPQALFARLLRRTVRTKDGCWQFTGGVNSRGYVSISAGMRGVTILGHRLAVLARDGLIPDGMTVDHQCHDSATCRSGTECPHRRCVNPAHLKLMTTDENTRRIWESGKCRKGHDLTARGDGSKRLCLTCRRERERRVPISA